MQKVEGSSPFSRLKSTCKLAGFIRSAGWSRFLGHTGFSALTNRGARRRSTVRSGHRSRSLVTICDRFVDSDVYAPIHTARVESPSEDPHLAKCEDTTRRRAPVLLQ